MLSLAVDKRTGGSGLGKLRASGAIPAVVYGAHQESTPITVSAREFEKIFREAGEASVIALTGLGAELPTLIHEVDLDPLTNRPRHIDFYAVTKGEKVEVAIPIEFIGESPAVKGGSSMIKVLHEIEIKADPMNLPKEFTVDISVLANVGDQIHVRDLKIPAGVELVVDADEVIVLIQQVDEEKVEETAADLSTIEVEGKGKEDEATEGEAEAKPE